MYAVDKNECRMNVDKNECMYAVADRVRYACHHAADGCVRSPLRLCVPLYAVTECVWNVFHDALWVATVKRLPLHVCEPLSELGMMVLRAHTAAPRNARARTCKCTTPLLY